MKYESCLGIFSNGREIFSVIRVTVYTSAGREYKNITIEYIVKIDILVSFDLDDMVMYHEICSGN